MSKVLEKLLKPLTESEILKDSRGLGREKKIFQHKPGRPSVPLDKKAKNFTLCLAPKYLEFLDNMVVKDTKVKGRGRKIRFIIDRFLEHEKRSLGHMKVLKESLGDLEIVLKSFGPRIKKGEKLNLTPKESASLDKAVHNIHLLIKILGYSPKTLQRILPREFWEILSFSLDWKNKNRRVIL
jgi:hypothetical protein